MIYYSLVMDAEARHSSICSCVCQRVSSHRACCSARHALRGHLFADGVTHVPTCSADACAVGQYAGDGYTDRFDDPHTNTPCRRGTPAVVATVQGQPIAAEDLTNALRGELLRLQIQRYQTLREKLDDLIAHKIFSLEAAQRGVSVQQFVHDEISAKIQTVTPEQVQAFYEANKNRIKQPLEKVSEQITSYLQQQAQEQRRQALLKELRSRYPVTVALRAPTVETRPRASRPWGLPMRQSRSSNFPIFSAPTAVRPRAP